MGLFDFFKKKKPAATVTFTESTYTHKKPQATPPRKNNSNTEYGNAVFLSMHKTEAHKQDHCVHMSSLSHKLGISDPIKKHQELFYDGYFREARPADILKKSRVAELKEILEKNNQPTTGKKAELIERIVETIPADRLRLPKMYCLSSKGWDFIEQHKDLIDLFYNPYDISYEEYKAAKADAPTHLSYNDIIWRVFNRNELSLAPNDIVSRRHIAWCRGKFLYGEKKYSGALEERIAEAYYTINDPMYFYIPSDGEPFEKKIDDCLTNSIIELREYYVELMAVSCAKRSSISRKYISDQNFVNFINNLFSTKDGDFSKYV